MPKKIEQPASFETAFKKLEQIVNYLELGELPLKQVLNEFEHNMRLAQQAQETLQQAEQQVQILLNNTSNTTLAPLRQKMMRYD